MTAGLRELIILYTADKVRVPIGQKIRKVANCIEKGPLRGFIMTA
jgi:hypothetical protein